MDSDNAAAQTEELETLKAIYEEDLQLDRESGNHSVLIKAGKEGNELTASFEFIFPSDYPSQSPPVFEIKCIYLEADDVDHIFVELEKMYSKGEVVLYQWIEWIREYLTTKKIKDDDFISQDTISHTQASQQGTSIKVAPTLPPQQTPTNSQVPISGAREKSRQTVVYLDPPEWIHGEPITDRKSTFQAHAAIVQTTNEVEAGLAYLKTNKKIASATHNILAYRMIDTRKRALVQDCDDDGETAAGGRLLHLLQIMDVMDVLVVVTRWYGGIHLGPDRFKHINNAARLLLQKSGIGSRTEVSTTDTGKKSKSLRIKKK